MEISELHKSLLSDDQNRYIAIQNELNELMQAKKQAFDNLLQRARTIDLEAIVDNQFCRHETHQVVNHQSGKRISVCKVCGNLKLS